MGASHFNGKITESHFHQWFSDQSSENGLFLKRTFRDDEKCIVYNKVKKKNNIRDKKKKSQPESKEIDVLYLVRLKGLCILRTTFRKIRHWIKVLILATIDEKSMKLVNRDGVVFHQDKTRSAKRCKIPQISAGFAKRCKISLQIQQKLVQLKMSYYTRWIHLNLHLRIITYFELYKILFILRTSVLLKPLKKHTPVHHPKKWQFIWE